MSNSPIYHLFSILFLSLLSISKIVAYCLFLFVPKADLVAGVSSLSLYH
jgi:hypothetical protein